MQVRVLIFYGSSQIVSKVAYTQSRPEVRVLIAMVMLAKFYHLHVFEYLCCSRALRLILACSNFKSMYFPIVKRVVLKVCS